jgi:hypothetical protein
MLKILNYSMEDFSFMKETITNIVLEELLKKLDTMSMEVLPDTNYLLAQELDLIDYQRDV